MTNAQTHKFSFSTGGTVNVNDLNWSIAGNLEGQSPNILSELHFDDVTSLGFYLKATYRPVRFLELSGFYQRNGMISGQGKDIDYEDDNRTNPTFQQSFSSDKGSLEIFRPGLTFWFWQRSRLFLGGGVAYISTKQNFYLLSSDLDALQSTYDAGTKGVNINMEGVYRINEGLSLCAGIGYTFLDYHAEADWNLIDIFMHPLSFSQQARGRSKDARLGLRYTINRFLSLTANGTFGNMETFSGIDKSYLQNNTIIATRFNGAGNSFYGVDVGASINF